MSDLKSVEERRLRNLKILHGLSAEIGAPTSSGFASQLKSLKIPINKNELSDIYHRKKAIDLFLAEKIEQSFCLPVGWLSEDQSFWFGVSSDDALAMKKFSHLSPELKNHLFQIVLNIIDD